MSARILDRSDRSAQIIPIAAIAAGVALAAVVGLTVLGGGGGGGRGNDGIAAPPASPSPSPTVQPTAVPTPVPTAPADAPAPTDGGSDAIPIKVDLETANGADVYVDIVDQTGLLVDAVSGTPAEGQSVGAYTLQVENLDATTLRLSWVDYPIDNALALYIDEFEGGIRLLLVQPEPTGPTDSIAMDRELILSFSQPVSADQVEAFLQDGLDTPG